MKVSEKIQLVQAVLADGKSDPITETSLTIKKSSMPTFFSYNHKVVTPFGEMFIKTQEPADEGGVDNWIKANQDSINARFKDKAETLPVKVTAVYIVKGDGTERKL